MSNAVSFSEPRTEKKSEMNMQNWLQICSRDPSNTNPSNARFMHESKNQLHRISHLTGVAIA